jgi:uncharacterized protein
MSWKLESWNPEYALPERLGGEDGGSSAIVVKTEIEGDWKAHTPASIAPDKWPMLLFVDGRQRVEAMIADGQGRPAMLATVLAGAVLRDGGGIRPVSDPIKRHLWLYAGNEALPSSLSHYEKIEVKKTDPASLRSRITDLMRQTEVLLANQLSKELETATIIMDGQLYPGSQGIQNPERIVGYTKTQAAAYLPPEEQGLLFKLQPRQRSPIFELPGTPLRRPLDVYSWYVRLPLEPDVPFFGGAGLLRVETASKEPREAVQLANLSVSLFCAMASSPARDPRAPQNLVPIGGLEQWLGRYMGSAEVVRRKIIEALFDRIKV